MMTAASKAVFEGKASGNWTSTPLTDYDIDHIDHDLNHLL